MIASGSEAAWKGGARAASGWLSPGDARAASRFQWLHLCSLFVLLSLVGAASMMILDGLAFGSSLSRLPMLLHWWVPPALGIVAAALPVRYHSWRGVSLLVLAGTGLLILLDLSGLVLSGELVQRLVTKGGESFRSATVRNVHPDSWVMALLGWASGRVGEVGEVLERYPAGHPRVVVSLALAEAGAPFLALGTVGIVVGVRRWIAENVIHRNPSNDLVAGALLGWIMGPSLSVIASSLIGRRLSGATFAGEPLVSVLVPSVGFAAAGLLGLAYALRRS